MKKLIILSILLSNIVTMDAAVSDLTTKNYSRNPVKKISAEEKFENEKLILVYEIFHNTTRQNIEAFMKNKNFDAP